MSAFSPSAGMLSNSADLPFFSCLMAHGLVRVSYSVGGSQSIGRSPLAGGMSGGSCGAAVLSNSSESTILLTRLEYAVAC